MAEAISAPFRFARIPPLVHCPDWGRLVSHDVPFADGISGEATLRVTARTALLIGGARRRANAQAAGEVLPWQLPDGTWALPGSAVQGMARAILEVATFARLGPWIDDRRFGIRDLTGSATGAAHYGNRLTTKAGKRVTFQSQPGWLIRTDDGRHVIVPCKMARIRYEEVVKLSGNTRLTETLLARADAKQRIDAFLKGRPLKDLGVKVRIDPPRDWDHQNGRIVIHYSRAYDPSPGDTTTDATLVLTGKGSPGDGPGRKKLDFVFHGPDRATVRAGGAGDLAVDPEVWETFERLNLSLEEGGDREKVSPAWQVWKAEYAAGRPVPVFYWLENGRLTTFGLAMGFKAAFTHSTHALLRHSHASHIDDGKAPLDLPSLIFGQAADSGTDDNRGVNRGLKRRASFGLGIVRGKPAPATSGPTILAAPKPSYFPIYVRQEGKTAGELDGAPDKDRALYATYSPLANDPAKFRQKPELAGVKLWPATGASPFPALPAPPPPERGRQPVTSAVQSRLTALPAGTVFDVPLRFHNLRPMELGALLWALTWGAPAALTEAGPVPLRHRLGMGKPFHMGEVELCVTGLRLRPNKAGTETDPVKLIDAFRTYMTTEACNGQDWAETPQVRALLRAADPGQNRGEGFDYMTLGDAPGSDKPEGTYLGERQRHRFLPDYVDGKALPPAPARPVSVPLHRGARARVTAGEHAGKEGDVVAQNLKTGLWQVQFSKTDRRNLPGDSLAVIAPAPGWTGEGP